MIIRNKFITGLIYHFVKHKERKLSFSFEVGLIDGEVLDKAYVRQYITELRSAVEEEVETLTKEFEL